MDMDAALLVRREGHWRPRPTWNPDEVQGNSFRVGSCPTRRASNPEAIEFCLLLLSLGEDAVNGFNRAYEALVRKGVQTDNVIDVTLHFGEWKAGVTLHFNVVCDDDAMAHLQAHCEARKYSLRAMRWFGVSIGPDGQIHAAIAKDVPWEQSDDLDKLTAHMGGGRDWRELFAGLPEMRADSRWAAIRHAPAGSGKKYRECCQ